ncbi:MAG: hypothetical protein ACPGLV_15865, partial [Bacteroidia bacterium]
MRILTLLIAVTLITIGRLGATHVVGGEVFYNYLGNDSYYVHLQVYVDCENGRSEAISQDSTGTIAIYENLTYDLNKHREVFRTGPVRLNKLQYNCVQPPAGVCVDMYTYDTVFVLKPNTFGYYIAFQRCCRNESILNIEDPLGTGATYSAFIPPIEKHGANSNPRFKQKPPNYLCVNERFEFNHSATDPDGDSLAYRICTPKNMRITRPSKPEIPDAPPYIDVTWKAPYSEWYPLPVKNNFKIKPDGMLQFWPTNLGQYVFAVCVDEYRKGELLSTSWRDYQFNVMPCKFNVRANFKVPELFCGNEFELKDESTGAQSVKWIIKMPNETIESDLRNFNLSNMVAGNYNISLVATSGNCADTFNRKLTVLPKSLNKNYYLQKCKTDTLALKQRDYYALKTEWLDSTALFNIDTLKAYAGTKDTFFIHKGYFNECSFIDSYFVDVQLDTFSVLIEPLPHCLGTIYKMSTIDSFKYNQIIWRIKNDSFSNKHEHLVLNGQVLNLKLQLALNSCKDSAEYLL